MNAKRKLEVIAANAERVAAMPERERLLALLLLNKHLTGTRKTWTKKTG